MLIVSKATVLMVAAILMAMSRQSKIHREFYTVVGTPMDRRITMPKFMMELLALGLSLEMEMAVVLQRRKQCMKVCTKTPELCSRMRHNIYLVV